MQLEEALTKYLNCCRSEMREYTVGKKKRYLDYFLLWCKKPLEELTIDDIFQFFNELPTLTDEIHFRIRTDLKCFLRFLSETSDIKLPFTLIKAHKPAHKPTVACTLKEFELMRDWCYSHRENAYYLRWWAMVNMLFYLGCRRSELTQIELTNIDLLNKTVLFKVGKTNQYKVRRYFFNLEEYLKVWKPKKYLFSITPKCVREMVVALTEKCNIHHLTPHSFRAGLITYLSMQGWTIQDIAEYIGQTVEVTQGYINHNPQILLDKASQTFRKKREYDFRTNRFRVRLDIMKK